MTTLTMHTNRTEKGAAGPSEDRDRRHAGRRLVLVLVLLALVVVVAVGANYGHVRHYFDARQRLEKAAAEVSALQDRTAALQTELGKLSESGHLEDLARQQLTYALPGEELYVLADDPATTAGAESDEGTEGAAATGAGADDTQSPATGDSAAPGGPGLLERALLAIAALF